MRLKILIAAVVACVATGAAYLYFRPAPQFLGQGGAPATEIPAPGFAAASSTPANAGPLKPSRIPPAGYAEYRNEQYRFAFFYPTNLSIKAYDEGGGASTLAFQDVARAEGFQLFVVPYRGAQVSMGRFRQDEPSGIMRQPLSITIDGATATSFYSTNAALGDTAEIWFIQGGYLFEATAPKSEAQWFSNIMSTWQFI